MISTIIGFWYNEEKSNTNLVYCINFDYDLLLYKLLTIHHIYFDWTLHPPFLVLYGKKY